MTLRGRMDDSRRVVCSSVRAQYRSLDFQVVWLLYNQSSRAITSLPRTTRRHVGLRVLEAWQKTITDLLIRVHSLNLYATGSLGQCKYENKMGH